MKLFTFYVKMCKLCQLIFQQVFNQRKLYCNVLKSSQDQQEYAIKNDGFCLENDVILI